MCSEANKESKENANGLPAQENAAVPVDSKVKDCIFAQFSISPTIAFFSSTYLRNLARMTCSINGHTGI